MNNVQCCTLNLNKDHNENILQNKTTPKWDSTRIILAERVFTFKLTFNEWPLCDSYLKLVNSILHVLAWMIHDHNLLSVYSIVNLNLNFVCFYFFYYFTLVVVLLENLVRIPLCSSSLEKRTLVQLSHGKKIFSLKDFSKKKRSSTKGRKKF